MGFFARIKAALWRKKRTPHEPNGTGHYKHVRFDGRRILMLGRDGLEYHNDYSNCTCGREAYSEPEE